MEQVIAKNEWQKMINGKEFGENKPLELKIYAELVKRAGNDYAYFSITGSIAKQDKRLRDAVIMCGSIHEEILKHFPELAPLVLVHLSEADGHPMHAEANARYWAGLSKYADGSQMGEYKPRMLAQHLQTDKKTADEVKTGLEMGLPWVKIMETLKLSELWSSQAGKARALLIETAKVSA